MKAKLIGAIAALVLAAGASSAQAAIVTITYDGTVGASPYDGTGFFNGVAAGDTFEITYKFNTLLSCSQSTVLTTEDYTGSAQALIFRMPAAGGGA